MSDSVAIITTRITIITARSMSSFLLTRIAARCWALEAEYNIGKATFRSEAAARQFAAEAAWRRDRATGWAASMVFYALRSKTPRPAAPQTLRPVEAAQTWIVAASSLNTGNPRDSYRVLMDKWLADHPLPAAA